MAWGMGFKKIVLESDANEIFSRLLNSNYLTGSFLLVCIKGLLNRDWLVAIYHVHRDCNRISDGIVEV